MSQWEIPEVKEALLLRFIAIKAVFLLARGIKVCLSVSDKKTKPCSVLIAAMCLYAGRVD